MPPSTIRAPAGSWATASALGGGLRGGRPNLDRLGRLKAATLACGDDARLSHRSAAELWRIGLQLPRPGGRVGAERFAPPSAGTACTDGRSSGITRVEGRPDRRSRLGPHRPRGLSWATEEVEDAVNEADRLDLIRTHRLRPALDRGAEPSRRRPAEADPRCADLQPCGQCARAPLLRDRPRGASCRHRTTQRRLGPHRVDFFWPALGLVVETTASATTAPPPSRRRTSAAIRPMPAPACAPCASPTPRFFTVPITSARCSRQTSATFGEPRSRPSPRFAA